MCINVPEEINKVMVELEKFDVRFADFLLANPRHTFRKPLAVLYISKPGRQCQTGYCLRKSEKKNTKTRTRRLPRRDSCDL